MNEWVKIFVPIGLTLLLGVFGFFLNQGRMANCEAINDSRNIMRQILLLAPGLDDRVDERFLDQALDLLEERDCSLL